MSLRCFFHVLTSYVFPTIIYHPLLGGEINVFLTFPRLLWLMCMCVVERCKKNVLLYVTTCTYLFLDNCHIFTHYFYAWICIYVNGDVFNSSLQHESSIVTWTASVTHTPGHCTWLSDNTLPAFTCCLLHSPSLSLCFWTLLLSPHSTFFLKLRIYPFLNLSLLLHRQWQTLLFSFLF